MTDGEKNPRIRVALILRREGQILLVQHRKYGQTYWLLPGGGLEFGETIEECARRELYEETGLEASIGDLVFISESIPPDHHRHVVNLYYEGTLTGGTLEIEQGSVIAGASFVDIDRIPELDLRPPVQKELHAYLKNPSAADSLGISLGNRWEMPGTSLYSGEVADE